MPKVCLMCGESFPDTTTFCPRDGSALRAAVKGDDLIGELIGERYLITDLISHGGMGSVYVASDVRLPQQFAVKVLKEQMSPDPAVISRFRQEAEAVCRINHDRVARVFDFGFMDDGRAYIIMEYAAGRTLRDHMDDRCPMDLSDASKITMMMAEGLDAAHRLGIVHRDLKPENVMVLDDPGGTMRIKVLDFGIAKMMDAEAGKGYTQPGFVIGTPIWMSPEQLRGDTLDARSDVYSLALLTFAMLTGERPFVGDTEQTEMLARLAATPRTLAAILPHVQWPPELQSIFDRTFSLEVADRPLGALSFAEAVATVAANASADARSQQSSARGTPTPASVAAHTPSSASASASASRKKAASLPDASTPTSSRTKMMAFAGIGVAAIAIIAVAVLKPFSGDAAVATSGADSMSMSPMIPNTAPTTTPETTVVAAVDTGEASQTATNEVSSVTPGQKPADPPGRSATGTPPPVRPPANAGNSGGNVVAPKPVVETPPRTNSRNADLQRIMAAYDADGSATNSRITIDKIDALRSRLTLGIDKAYAQFYLGQSYATLKEKDQACAAFERAHALGAESSNVRSSSDDWRIMLGCRP